MSTCDHRWCYALMLNCKKMKLVQIIFHTEWQKLKQIQFWSNKNYKGRWNEEDECQKRPLRRLMIYSYKCLARRIVVVAITNIIENCFALENSLTQCY
jgi:hypothetical protein